MLIQYDVEKFMKKLKVVTVFGTRPEIIRLSRVMAKLDQYCDHITVHTGQNYEYELNEISFGKGKGYLNAGIRWAVSPNLMMEINLNDINQNTDAEYTNREIKIMYSESF